MIKFEKDEEEYEEEFEEANENEGIALTVLITPVIMIIGYFVIKFLLSL